MSPIEKEQKWIDFIKWVGLSSSGKYFRGVGDSYNHKLLPSVGRINNYSIENEVNVFEHFKLQANLNITAKTDIEWLTIAQHHSLPTRLLDWTENPLVACFFAVTEENSKMENGRIYSFTLNEHLNPIAYSKDNPFAIDGIKIIFPSVSTNRISLQRGLFSIQPFPNKPLLISPKRSLCEMAEVYLDYLNFDHDIKEMLPFREKNESDIDYQKRYYSIFPHLVFDIPADCKEYFEEKIRFLGIDETIFGDIDSIAKYLKHQLSVNKLSKVADINANYNFPEISNIVKRTFLKFNRDKLNNKIDGIELSNQVIILSNLKIFILKKEKYKYSGKGCFKLIPNFNKIDGLFWSIKEDEIQIVKKTHYILNLLFESFSEKYNFRSDPYFYFEFDFEFAIIERFISNISFKEDLKYLRKEIEELEKNYLIYTKLWELLNSDEKSKINNSNLKLDSIDFKTFAKNECLLKKLEPIISIFDN